VINKVKRVSGGKTSEAGEWVKWSAHKICPGGREKTDKDIDDGRRSGQSSTLQVHLKGSGHFGLLEKERSNFLAQCEVKSSAIQKRGPVRSSDPTSVVLPIEKADGANSLP
jgi:hypothetical protein